MQKIHILIRTHNRPGLFKRCLDSCLSQIGAYIKIHVCYDTETCDYIPNWCNSFQVTPRPDLPFGYDTYINLLKDRVDSGYFIILDDDDVLLPGVLTKLELDASAILVQINHLGRIVPKSEHFGLGQVGFPCLILHHSLKNLVEVSGQNHGDYHYIKEVMGKVPVKFQPLVLVNCDRKGNGL